MRETNALLKKREDDREETSSTGIQGFTICLIGHLFDTKGLNEVLNACEEYDVHFRVVDWDVGLNVTSQTQVTIQVMSLNDTMLDESRARIDEICKKLEIKVVPATGPAYDE